MLIHVRTHSSLGSSTASSDGASNMWIAMHPSLRYQTGCIVCVCVLFAAKVIWSLFGVRDKVVFNGVTNIHTIYNTQTCAQLIFTAKVYKLSMEIAFKCVR